MTKIKEALLNRLEIALQDLYHNATPKHPIIPEKLWECYNCWFNNQAEFEIEYISDGLGCLQKEYKRQQKLGFTGNERYFWLVSRITEFGKLYTWGRGGRTLAPKNLIKQRGGGSFSIINASEFEDYSNEALTDIIQVIEAFNHYVEQWNSKENLKAIWKERKIEELAELKESARHTRKELRKLVEAAREQMLNGTICQVVQKEIDKLKHYHKTLIAEIILWKVA